MTFSPARGVGGRLLARERRVDGGGLLEQDPLLLPLLFGGGLHRQLDTPDAQVRRAQGLDDAFEAAPGQPAQPIDGVGVAQGAPAWLRTTRLLANQP